MPIVWVPSKSFKADAPKDPAEWDERFLSKAAIAELRRQWGAAKVLDEAPKGGA